MHTDTAHKICVDSGAGKQMLQHMKYEEGLDLLIDEVYFSVTRGENAEILVWVTPRKGGPQFHSKAFVVGRTNHPDYPNIPLKGDKLRAIERIARAIR